MIPSINLGGSFSASTQAGGGGGPSGDGTTWNSSDKTTNMSLSSGDLVASANTSNFEMVRTVKSDFNTSTGGKFYFEILVNTLDNTSDIFVGLKATANTITSGSTPLAGSYALWRGNGAYFNAGGWSAGSSPTTFVAGNVLMIAIDADNGRLFLGKNGTWNNSGDPAAGTNASFSSMPSATDFAVLFSTDNVAGAVQVTLVSDPDNLTYSAPSGFTAGLPPP
jgi:hypothetical protein